ncbi:protein transport protein HofC [Tatumella sp. UBA2305]|uniref:protein transport protein HofC n=1 Tax=Tatumella sp. UBA2305 TaxID=1947647 RepID=UPI0025DC002D|nr:protein transport protein HofC [Tatumella sp. UBA2305]
MDHSILFDWQAVNRQGEYCAGSTLVRTRQQLVDFMQTEGLVATEIIRRKTYSARHWRWPERILFFSQTGTLLQAGLPLADGLSLLAGSHPARHWRSVMLQLQQQILSGQSFSVALRQWPEIFPPVCISLVSAGEQTGQLEYCCIKLAQQQQRQLQLKQQLFKAMRYPLFMLLLTVLISSGMLLWVLPEFAAIYRSSNTPLPEFTRLLISLSDNLIAILPGIVVLLITLIFGWRIKRRSNHAWQLTEQRFMLRLPLAGVLWQSTILAQIFSVLALTQQSGLPLREGLKITEELQHGILWQQGLDNLRMHIEQGQSLSSGLIQQVGFPPLCYMLTRLGEQTGTLDHLFGRLADWYETQASRTTADLTASVEPVMLLITGIITGSILVAMYLPMFSLGEALL